MFAEFVNYAVITDQNVTLYFRI